MEFLAFSHSSYRQTLEKWMHEEEQYLGFPGDVQRRMSWIEGAIDSQNKSGNNSTLAYGVFSPNEEIAIATCELVLSDKGSFGGKWLKMLKVTLSPEVDYLLGEEDMTATQSAVKAYKAATLGAFSARLDHDADTLKLYGRNDEQLRFLMTLLTVLQAEQNSTLTASKEGRWLVLREK